MESKHSLYSQQKAGNTAGYRVAPWLAGGVALAVWCSSALGAEVPAAARFRKDVQPILKQFCYDCHGDGAKKGVMKELRATQPAGAVSATAAGASSGLNWMRSCARPCAVRRKCISATLCAKTAACWN